MNFQGDTIPQNSQGQDIRKFFIDLIETILLAMVIFLGINFMSSRIRVTSYSMEPTLYDGDFVLVDKLTYKFNQPARGDIIIFDTPKNIDDKPYIKRVIGLPGEIVTIKDGMVSIGGHELHEKYIVKHPGYNGSWTVPEGSIFVLGDNRNNSSDSHIWGSVPISNVIGKAQVVYWPPEGWQILKPSSVSAAGLEP